jgi:membrane protein implicated in regulation of membrane protease activity
LFIEGNMETWFASLSAIDRFFAICAGVGSLGVLLRLLAQMLGFAGDGFDGGDIAGGDADLGDGAAHQESDGFKIISVHGLAAFFMMFGLAGFAMHRESNAPTFISIIVGAIAGAAAVWIITKLFQMANKLQSVGNLDISRAVGCSGTVYLKIPKGGSGRVVVNIRGRQREMDAVHVHGEEIDSGQPIVVVGMNENIAEVDFPR